MKRPVEMCSHEDVEWMKALKAYDYPKRPCDTKCGDGCPARPSCPLYRAWEYQTKKDAE